MLTLEQRIKVVELYFSEKSVKRTQLQFCSHYSVRKAPTKSTILRLVKKFKSVGNVRDKPHTGRVKTARTPDNIERVRQSVLQSPKTSSHLRSLQLQMSETTVRRVLKSDLQLFPYKIQIKQSLTEADKQSRVQMCNWFNDQMESNKQWITNVWFSDEAHFYVNGVVNRQNYRYWGAEKPQEVAERPLHSPKCTCWCAVSVHGIIGPFWVEENGVTATVNAERYRSILTRFWSVLVRRRGIDRDIQWFQQDGATPHTAHLTLEWLQRKFNDRLISRNTPNIWASHSPDLNPPDFFLWGYVKDRVYVNKPRDINELKEAASEVIRGISADVFRNVIENFAVRIRECLLRNGAHIEHVL